MMDPALIVILVVVALAVVLGATKLLRRRPELPPSEPKHPELGAPAEKPRAEEKEQKSAFPDAEITTELRPSDILGASLPEEPEVIAPPPVARPAPPRKSVPTTDDLAALKKGLASTRGGFISRLAKVFGRRKEIDPALLDEVEEVLITADIGVGTTRKILERLRERMEKNELSSSDQIWSAIRDEARSILGPASGGIVPERSPTVILVVGVNGVGKTTTIGKLASRYHQEGKKVLLAAGDTFRAAAVLQLEVWGRRVGCEVVKGKEKADPASVIFEAVKKAQSEGIDVVIADTAGRLHTKSPLMDELAKVGRTVEKALGRPADETILVLDSTTGQNAIQQAQLFKEALSLSGIVLTKLDGTAKGGVILGIVDAHGIPVRYIGIGERVDDLREFDPDSFVSVLFDQPDESMAA